MSKTRENPVAKAMYDRRDLDARRRVGRWNPGGVPYGVRSSRMCTLGAPLPTGLDLNTVPRRGGTRSEETGR